MATEIEMKLSVPDQATLDKVLSDPQLLQYARDDYEVRHMKSTYYDTTDNQLHQRKWTLRLRDEGGQTLAAFKTANRSDEAGFFTRSEWQCSVDNIEDAIPMLIDQGAPRELKSLLKGRELVPCCGAEFDRKAVCLYMDEGVRIEIAGDLGCLFSGDSLFQGSIGRTDLAGGSFDELREAIRSHLFTLPPETVVYPGHDESTTIGKEMKDNPYFR